MGDWHDVGWQRHHHRRQAFAPGFGPWGGPGGFPGPFFGRGARVGRGDVRAAILFLLAEGPMHGYQIIQELGERSSGVWRPSPGSIYPTLQQLEDEGLVRGSESDGRRVFDLTDEGRTEVERRSDEPRPWEMSAEAAPFAWIREEGFAVAHAVMQVARTGTPAQIARAREILGETRKSLYRLLAEDDPKVTEEA